MITLKHPILGDTMSIAAFFDLDGTLLPAPSLELRFRTFLRQQNLLGPAAALRWLARYLVTAGVNPVAAAHADKAHYSGVPASALDEFASSLLVHPPPVFAEARERMDWHAKRGHRIFVISGSLDPLAAAVLSPLSGHLAANCASLSFCANQLEVCAGRFTGRLHNSSLCGPGKVRKVLRLAAALRLDLPRCYAYSNGITDRWMLSVVGLPHAVNPDPVLHLYSRLHGWPILRWRSSSPSALPPGLSRLDLPSSAAPDYSPLDSSAPEESLPPSAPGRTPGTC